MCQIFAGKANKIRATLLDTKDLLEDLYDNNSDGLGAMYATSKKVLRMPKVVPKNLAEARAFIAQLPDDDRNLVIHFRMKTSGKIDQDNAHPFVVLPGLMGMTHNGVLTIDMKSDPHKCDSRHYIEQVLRPQLELAPELVRVKAWTDFVGDDIGRSNRFVFMDNEGNMTIVNEDTGTKYDGMWLANEYSFDASLLIPGRKPRMKYSGGHFSNWDNSAYAEWHASRFGTGNVVAIGKHKSVLEFQPDEVWEAITACDPDLMVDLLLEDAEAVFTELFAECEFVPGDVVGNEFSLRDEAIMKRLADGDAETLQELVAFSDTSAKNVAQAMVWYGDWVGKAINDKDDAQDVIDAVARAIDNDNPRANGIAKVKAAEAELQEELDREMELVTAAGETVAV